MQLKQRFFITIIAFVVGILFINNAIFYLTTKQILVRSVEEQSLRAAGSMRNSIDRYKNSVKYVEDMIGEQLRLAAIAAKIRLSPHAEEVTSAQLAELSAELGISHITLLKRVKDDIIGIRSSDMNEIGISTKRWGYWYTAFQQLFDYQQVTIEEGQKLPNYWSGPIEHSDSNPDRIDKWGYYYDGTTDYIINPYVEDIQIKQYDKLAGPDVIMNNMLELNPNMLEMTGFNYNTFGKPMKISKSQSGQFFVSLYDRPIPFGRYIYIDTERDVASVRTAIETNRSITYTTTAMGRKVIKSFIPVQLTTADREVDYPYVIGVVFDYEGIRGELNAQIHSIVIRVAVMTAISLLMLLVVYRMIIRSKDEAVRVTQEAYIDEVNEMFTTIRGQRHDFLNQVQTMYSFLQLKKYDELHRYMRELIGDIHQMNDIIQIGHPAIAAIVQSKAVTAMDKKIDFRHQFSPFGSLTLGVKSVDIVRIIGNLVDNAFDEVVLLPAGDRWVELRGWYNEGNLYITVRNPGRTLGEEEKIKIFEPGYTTKHDGHSGIGLAITRERVAAYKGSIKVESDEVTGTTFTVVIPLERFVR